MCSEVAAAERSPADLGGVFERSVDSIYLGGGTPSVLAPDQLKRIFAAVRDHFDVTAELPKSPWNARPAPSTTNILDTLLGCGVNRVSLGVQSFVDKESSSVGRLHTRAVTLDDIARLRAAGNRQYWD